MQMTEAVGEMDRDVLASTKLSEKDDAAIAAFESYSTPPILSCDVCVRSALADGRLTRSSKDTPLPISSLAALVPCVHDASYVIPKPKKGDTAQLPKQRIPPTATQAMQAARQGNALKGKKPSLLLSIIQWSRANLLLENVELDRFREGDMGYLNALIDAALKKNKLPRQFRKQANGKFNFKAKVRETIQHLFQTPTDLPYEIDHWKIADRWMGMGLFTTRRIHTQTLGHGLSKAEPNNCELLWAEACHEGYDSVYTCNWQETIESAQVKWGMKQHLVSNVHKVKRNHIGFRELFAVFGRLMFANHHDDADFFFENFTPITPKGKNERIQGKLTIRPHNKEHWRYLEPREQILVFYDYNMTFGNGPAESEGILETSGNIDVALSMMNMETETEPEGIMMSVEVEKAPEVEMMSREEELEWALNDPVMEKGRKDDDDLFEPGGKRRAGKKREMGRRGRRR